MTGARARAARAWISLRLRGQGCARGALGLPDYAPLGCVEYQRYQLIQMRGAAERVRRASRSLRRLRRADHRGPWRADPPAHRQIHWPEDEKANEIKRAILLDNYLHDTEQYFAFVLSRALNLPVWAGPVGWGSDPYEMDGSYDPKTYPANHYTWKGKFPPDLKRRSYGGGEHQLHVQQTPVDFIKTILRANVDPVGYVEYKPSWFQAARDATRKALNSPTTPTRFDEILRAPSKLVEQLLDRIGSSSGS
jgi:hypothetical protein